ncbi:hypothetical protein ACIRRI_52025 [Streptomyces mirabilis]|uniref:hypothetical protein n=1 Tax=Streptomyces mirabilis TaxID=68239 RepID=UPI0038025E10
MQHRTWGFAAVGVAAVGLCAVLATTALASSDHGTERQAIKQSQTAAAKPGASCGVKPVAGSTKQAQTAAQQPAKRKVSSSDGTKSQMSEENQLLLKMQIEIKASSGGPTAAQVTKANKQVGVRAPGRSVVLGHRQSPSLSK